MLTGAMIGLGVLLFSMLYERVVHAKHWTGWDYQVVYGEAFTWVAAGTFIGWLVEVVL